MNEVAKDGGGELSEAEELTEKVAIAKRLIEAQTADVLKRKKDFEAKTVTLNGAKVTGVLRSSERVRLVEPKPNTIEQTIAEEVREELRAKPPMTGVGEGFTHRDAEEPKAEPKEERKEEPKAKLAGPSFPLHKLNFKQARTKLQKAVAAARTLGVSFSYDKFRGRYLVAGHALQEWVGDSVEKHILVMRSAVNERFLWEVEPDVFKDAVLRLCLENSFNPVLNYLDGLVWDGTPRIDRWQTTYLSAADTLLNSAIGRKLLIAGVRRVRKPGTKFDQITVWEGEQGTGKSEVIKILAGEGYYTDAEILGLAAGRDVQELCSGVWIYEISELEGIGKRDVAHVKAFATRQFDKARPAYGRAVESPGRTCVFIGTTNSKDYLADETGNRRFSPVETGKIDLDGLRRDRDQLWAEAVVAEAAGETLVIDKELWDEAAAVVGGRRPDDPWEDILARVERAPNAGGSVERADGCVKVTTEFLLNGVLGISPEKVSQTHTKRLARVMDRLGWEKPPNIRIGAWVGKGYSKKIE